MAPVLIGSSSATWASALLTRRNRRQLEGRVGKAVNKRYTEYSGGGALRLPLFSHQHCQSLPVRVPLRHGPCRAHLAAVQAHRGTARTSTTHSTPLPRPPPSRWQPGSPPPVKVEVQRDWNIGVLISHLNEQSKCVASPDITL